MNRHARMAVAAGLIGLALFSGQTRVSPRDAGTTPPVRRAGAGRPGPTTAQDWWRPDAASSLNPSTPVTVPAGQQPIRICQGSGHAFPIEQAAVVYKQKHPEVTFAYVPYQTSGVEAFISGNYPVLPADGYFMSRMGRYKWSDWVAACQQTGGAPPTEVVYAYWPVAVMVHPQNPVSKLSVEQLRGLVASKSPEWKDVGWADGGPVKFEGVWMSMMLDPLGIKPGELPATRWHNDPLAAAAENRACMFFACLGRENAASGLKVLSLVRTGQEERPDDQQAVASGRYPLRVPIRIILHPKANEAERQFTQWLTTPEAAKVITDAPKDMGVFAARYPFYVNVAYANSPPPAAKRPVATTLPDVRFDKPISGAVAVLPAVKLSLYFQMSPPAVLAAYENAVSGAIEADRRLTVLDRANLAKVLAERVSALARTEEAPGQMLACDVLVYQYMLTRGSTAILRIEALHAPTAGVLGSLELPIDPAQPTQFAPPLEQQVRRWWPAVLQALDDVRAKSVWTLIDVYPADRKTIEQADIVQRELTGMLAGDDKIFLARRIPLGQTQEELLMALMGISRSSDGRFTPKADYMVEARMTAPTSIELRVRQGDLRVVGQTTIRQDQPDKLLVEAKAWVQGVVAGHRDKPKIERKLLAGSDDDWARAQAKLEYAVGQEILATVTSFSTTTGEGKSRPGLTYAEGMMALERDRQREREGRSHMRRAAQLDPTWEEGAYAALSPRIRMRLFVAGVNRQESFTEVADAYRRFLSQFPRSTHRDQVWRWLEIEMGRLYDWSIAPGHDQPIDSAQCYRLWVHTFMDWTEDYLKRNGSGFPIDKAGQLASIDRTQLVLDYSFFLIQFDNGGLTVLPDAEKDELVKEWAARFDKYGPQAVDSRFIQLIVLASRKDKEGYLKLLAALQEQFSNPADPQWKYTHTEVSYTLNRLFPVRNDLYTLLQWLDGKRGPGDLPYVGYKPGSRP